MVVELGDYGNCLLLPHLADALCTVDFRAPECCCATGLVATAAIDSWGVGMIAAEMLGIHDALSGGVKRCMRQADCLPAYRKALQTIHGLTFDGMLTVDQNTRNDGLVRRVKAVASDAAEASFVLACLEPDPKKRLSASDALRHRYFDGVGKEIEVTLASLSNKNAAGRPLCPFDFALLAPGDYPVEDRWWGRLIMAFSRSVARSNVDPNDGSFVLFGH